MTYKRYFQIFLFLIIILTLGSCAPKEMTTTEFGFFNGILHGICLPFALIGKIFGAEIGIHAINNSGTFYWLGYLIGIGSVCGGASKS